MVTFNDITDFSKLVLGIGDGLVEGIVEGIGDGIVDGLVEGIVEGIGDGIFDGLVEKIVEGIGDGIVDGTGEKFCSEIGLNPRLASGRGESARPWDDWLKLGDGRQMPPTRKSVAWFGAPLEE